MGPAGLEARQPSWSSTPSLGAWPYLWGGVAPHLPVHKGQQCGGVDVVSGVSEIRPAGLGLTYALAAGVGRDLWSVGFGPWIYDNDVFFLGPSIC